MIHLELETLPVSTNLLYYYYRGSRILSKRGRENKYAMAREARVQYRGAPLEDTLKLRVALWWPTKRNHDVDNIKSLLDSLTGIVWVDDGQIVDLHITKGYDKSNPRVVLDVEKIDVA